MWKKQLQTEKIGGRLEYGNFEKIQNQDLSTNNDQLDNILNVSVVPNPKKLPIMHVKHKQNVAHNFFNEKIFVVRIYNEIRKRRSDNVHMKTKK